MCLYQDRALIRLHAKCESILCKDHLDLPEPVKRASRQKIAWFCKKMAPLIEERRQAGYTVCVQDEAICVADALLRKGIYTPKGVRGVYTYTGSHSKTVVFGLLTLDEDGFFQRYDSFTGKSLSSS